MQSYKKLLTMDDFEELFVLYDQINPADLPSQIKKISNYLADSYREARDIDFKDCEELAIDEYISWLEDLDWCVASMLNFRDRSLILSDPERGIKVNVLPLMDFMAERGDLKSLQGDLDEIKSLVINYSTSQNNRDTKSIYKLLGQLAYLFNRIEENHQENGRGKVK